MTDENNDWSGDNDQLKIMIGDLSRMPNCWPVITFPLAGFFKLIKIELLLFSKFILICLVYKMLPYKITKKRLNLFLLIYYFCDIDDILNIIK